MTTARFHGKPCRWSAVLAMLWLIVVPAAVIAAVPPVASSASSVARLQAEALAKAQARNLAADPTWRALLHYEPNTLGDGVHSEVASSWFFLAGPAGRRDPAAELSATLAALFSARPIGPHQRPAYCVFVARRRFLVHKLGIERAMLPVRDCPDYRRWRATLAPQAANLVFPAAFPNSPSSMFGHTLLRIDSAHRAAGTELLSYAVNFAAAAPDDKRGVGFVWKGLTGGYPGVFGLFPYYKKVKQYAWIENRDVWSYRLHLTPAELDRMVDHIWEMDGVEFTYYFLNKNCSYQLLSLIDVARPGLHLTQQYHWYAIPSDTIRSLADVPGLLGPARYRPSMEARLRAETAQLSDHEQALARDIAQHRLAPEAPAVRALPDDRQAGVLETAYDGLHYQRVADGVDAPIHGATATHTADRILDRRAALGGSSPFQPVRPPARSPEMGHRSLRVNAATVVADDRLSLAFRLRPAYHDLLDDPGGYTRGQAINLADLGLALDPGNGHVAVSDFTALSITSLSGRDAWFKPVSFTLSTGARRRPASSVFTERDNGLGYYLQGGPGLAWGHDKLIGYVFGQLSFDANPALQPAYAIGAGPSAGLLWYPASGVQLQADSGWLQYAAGANGHYGWAGLGAQLPLIDGLALRSHVTYEQTAFDHGLRLDVGIQAYF